MSEARQPYLSPQDVAEILGVGVSTVKRLVDAGRLPARQTLGRHRRIEPGEVLRLVESGNYPCADRGALRRHAPVERLAGHELEQSFHDALLTGDVAQARGLLLAAFDAGESAARLGDGLVAPVMRRVGHGWASERLDVYEEHRATQTCLAALHGLRSRLAERPAAPLALGGGPEGDHYALANVCVELALLEDGWRVVNVGPNTPAASFVRAIGRFRPRLVWLSCSFVPDEAAFAEGYAALRSAAASAKAALAVGGNAAPALPDAEHRGTTLAGLVAFARTLRQ